MKDSVPGAAPEGPGPLEAIAESLRELDARLATLEDRRETRRGDAPPALLLDVKSVAALLSCSWRSVYRLVDQRRFPPPIRLGALCRWSRPAIEAWLEERIAQGGR